MIKCSECGNKGATVGCNVKNCGEHYHYPCARTSSCAFMVDKTVYCPQHLDESCKKKCLTEKTFEVLRPVYVELDRRKKKLVEPSKIQFLIGSLNVKQIGRFVPVLSDHSEAIVPNGFTCTRLYWSSKEPWKIVEYTVKTSVQSNNYNQIIDCGRNFTVDHSNNFNLVQLGLTQINKWHTSLINGDDFEIFLRDNNKALKQFLVQNCSEDQNDEEPQNNADLLPPELKDAIFEDLPHDVLDGISMLDIFAGMDSKSEGFFDLLKDAKDSLLDEDMDDNQRSSDGQDCWPSVGCGVDDSNLSAGTSRELKRSKSEIFSRNGELFLCYKFKLPVNHQISSSFYCITHLSSHY